MAKTSENLMSIQEDLFRGRFEHVERKVTEMEKEEGCTKGKTKGKTKGCTKEEKKVTNDSDSGPFCDL